MERIIQIWMLKQIVWNCKNGEFFYWSLFFLQSERLHNRRVTTSPFFSCFLLSSFLLITLFKINNIAQVPQRKIFSIPPSCVCRIFPAQFGTLKSHFIFYYIPILWIYFLVEFMFSGFSGICQEIVLCFSLYGLQ